MTAADNLSDRQFPGVAWRQALPAEHEAMLARWQDHPAKVGQGADRAAFRKVISTAPQTDQPVYRGDEVLDGPYGIAPLDKTAEDFRAKAERGDTVRFARHSSVSTRPEIAGGFGHTL